MLLKKYHNLAAPPDLTPLPCTEKKQPGAWCKTAYRRDTCGGDFTVARRPGCQPRTQRSLSEIAMISVANIFHRGASTVKPPASASKREAMEKQTEPAAHPSGSAQSTNLQKKTPQKASSSPAWRWWQRLGSPRFILSPMVGQSELAYRMICRKFGVELCYTPMFIAESFVRDAEYRKRIWSTCKEDRPLFVQFCGDDPEVG